MPCPAAEGSVPAFNPKAIREMEDDMREFCRDLIAGIDTTWANGQIRGPRNIRVLLNR